MAYPNNDIATYSNILGMGKEEYKNLGYAISRAATTSDTGPWVRQSKTEYAHNIKIVRDTFAFLTAHQLEEYFNMQFARRWMNTCDVGDLRMYAASRAQLKVIRQEMWRALSEQKGITCDSDVLVPRRG